MLVVEVAMMDGIIWTVLIMTMIPYAHFGCPFSDQSFSSVQCTNYGFPMKLSTITVLLLLLLLLLLTEAKAAMIINDGNDDSGCDDDDVCRSLRVPAPSPAFRDSAHEQ